MSHRRVIVWTVTAGLGILGLLGWSRATNRSPLVVFATPVTGVAPAGERSASGQETERAVGVVAPGATKEQAARLELAVDRYHAAGLSLPRVEVSFPDTTDDCGGAKGRFSTETSPWTIRICSAGVPFVYEHELAHAWERAYLGEAQRQGFMDRYEYDVWRSHEAPWNERAVERIALVIQQGVSGLPLPPMLGVEATARVEAFEFLTGMPDPRLVAWLGAKHVSCSDRPTPMSAAIPDEAGVTCA